MIVNGSNLFEAKPIKDMLDSKQRMHGVSYGLTEAGYDIRLKQDIHFIPGGNKFFHYFPLPDESNKSRVAFSSELVQKDCIVILDKSLDESPLQIPDTHQGRFIIASALEEFQMPKNLVGVVHDKSTWARRGLSVFNTVIEPGWKGFLTLELVYHGQDKLHLPAGCGIAQVLFSEIAVHNSYDGKYQNQADKPVGGIFV